MRRPAISALIEQMTDPDFFPHDATHLHVVQTHISWVVLTGPYAYKIKKPVDLGFLDFTTLEQRKHYCEEELRLNRAFAPDLYLEVAALYKRDGDYTLEPEAGAEPVEYAVKMRQFDEKNLLRNIFERGEMTLNMAREMGEHLARIHAAAPANSRIARFGNVDMLRQTADENFAVAARFVDAALSQSALDQMQRYIERFLSSHAALIKRRVEEGRVRECHGDLHLGNICLFEGKLELFDRIEFNDAYKNIDVVYDLAFLVMDLEFRGRPDLANRVLNTWLERTGDYEGAALLPLYLIFRAQIRAKVACLLSEDVEVDAKTKENAIDEASRYFDYAEHHAHAARGRIVMMCGVSGSGKSTVAAEIASGLNAVHIRSDAVRKHLAGVELDAPGQGIYTEAWDDRTYAELARLASLLAGEGLPVVLDAKYDRRDRRREVEDLARHAGVPVTIMECRADPATLRRRLEQRKDDVSDATAALLDEQLAQFESLDETERAYAVVVDGDAAMEDVLKKLTQ